MKVLSLWQPWCSLCVEIDPKTGQPYKTIETRGWQSPKSLIGQRIALHAAKRRPPGGLGVGPWWVGVEPIYRGFPALFTRDRDGCIPLPLGAIVATCTLEDVVPMTNLGEETAARRIEIGTMGGEPNLMLCAPDPTWHDLAVNEAVDLAGGLPPDDPESDPESGVDFDASDYYERDVTDQLPYGLFESGRYAWLLADVVPVDPPVPFKGGQGLTKEWEPS